MREGGTPQNARGNFISSYVLDERIAAAMSLVPDGKGRLLDVCCGEGHFLKALEGSYRGGLFGFDICEANVQNAKRICGRARVFVGDARARVFPVSGKFSTMTLLEALDHFEKPELLLKALVGRLDVGGTLVVSVPDAGSALWNVVWAGWTATLGARWREAHKAQFDEAGLRRLLERAGLRVVGFRRAFFGMIMTASGVKDE